MGDYLDKKNEIAEEQPQQPQMKSKLFLIVAICCFAAGCVLLGLALGLTAVVKGVGVYLLISSMVCELASLTFLNAQKRNGENRLCFVFKILSYAVMAAAVIVFAIGIGFGSAAK